MREEDLRELSFIEQLNDYLFIKYNDIDLIILDMVSNKLNHEFLKISNIVHQVRLYFYIVIINFYTLEIIILNYI